MAYVGASVSLSPLMRTAYNRHTYPPRYKYSYFAEAVRCHNRMRKQLALIGKLWRRLLLQSRNPNRVLALSKELAKALEEDSKQRLERVTSESQNKSMSETEESSGKSAAPQTLRVNARVRCPYCAENGKFREMIAQSDGARICNNCGHVTLPHDPEYSCTCRNCGQIAMFALGH